MNCRRHVVTSSKLPACVLSWTLMACSGKAADLGRDAPKSEPDSPVYASGAPVARPLDGTQSADAPWKLVDRLVAVDAIGVEHGRVFWVGRTATGDGFCSSPAAFYSCDVADCAATVGTWQDSAGYGVRKIEVAEGRAHIGGEGSNSGFAVAEMSSCAVGDCSRSTSDIVNLEVKDFVLSEGTVYALGYAVIVSCRAADCSSSIQRVPMRAPDGVESFLEGSRIAADDEYLYVLANQRILRVRKDGTMPFEVVVQTSTSMAEIAVDQDNVYWSEPVMLGTLSACPKTGCQGAPEILVKNLNCPTKLLVDDTNLYFIEPRDTNGEYGSNWSAHHDRLLRCSKLGCAEPTVVIEGAGIGASFNHDCPGYDAPFVMDERFLYFASCDPALLIEYDPMHESPSYPPAVPGCGIGVIPK